MEQFEIEGGPAVVADCGVATAASALYLWLPVGSAREHDGISGAAHLLEHMLFKGAGGLGPGEAAARIERLGGDINAFTSYEQTVLHCTVPAGREDEALAILAEMLARPTIDPVELERERDVVIEEIRGVRDEADQVLGETLRARAFAGHPYGRPILGTEASVRGMSREALLGFHHQHYQLSRTIFAYAGPCTADEVRALAERHLMGGPVVDLPALPPPSGPDRRRFVTLDEDFDDRLVEIAFAVPGLRHPDMAALDLLVTAVGEGDSGLLARTLRTELGLASDTWAAMEPEPLGSLLVFGLAAREGKTEAAVEALGRVLALICDEGVGADALHRARRSALGSRLYDRETVDGRAFRLAWYKQHYGDPEGEARYETALLRVTPADVLRVARQWLNPQRAVVAAIAPKRALSSARLSRAFESGFPVPGPQVPRRAPAIERRVLSCGATVVIAPDPNAELVGVSLVGVGGAIAEGGTAGLADVWAATVERGAGRREAVDFAAAAETLGGRLSAWTWRNSSGMTASFPAGDLSEGIELLADMLLAPRFDVEEVERAQAELEEARLAASDAPAELAIDLCWQSLFPGHPWGRPSMGTAAGLRRSTPGRLRAYHRRVMCGRNLSIALAGAVEPRALRRLDRVLAALPEGAPFLPRPAHPPAAFSRERRRRVPRQQAWAVLAFPGAGWGEPDAAALSLAEGVLGGQSGRLFLDLREKRGLAYDVAASAEEGLGGGAFFCSIGTDPARVDEAIEGLWACLDGLVRAEVDAHELDSVRARIVDGAAIELQRSSALAARLASAERYGPGAERFREVIEAPARVDAAALRDVAARVFRRDRCVLVRVEPRR